MNLLIVFIKIDWFVFFFFLCLVYMHIDLQKHGLWTTIARLSPRLSNPSIRVLIFTQCQRMNNGCRKNMRERNWPLNNLSTTSVRICVCAHTHTQEREEEDVNKVYTHVHTHICAAGELQRTDSKEWIDERTDEQMARPRTFFSLLSCAFYVHWYSDSMRA